MFDREKPFNDLPLLPPSEDKILTKEVLLLLSQANRSLGKLDGMSQRLPNPLMLVNTIALKEAKSSSEIENIFTTEDELYKALSTTDTNISPAAKEVLRYRESLWEGINSLANKTELDFNTLISIYQKIKETSQGVRSPQANVRIVKGGSSLTSGKVVYTPPNNEGLIVKLYQNLLDFINDDEKYPYDPLLKMAIAHYQFEAIHPFSDGNGRTGRILNVLILIKKDILKFPILYLSKYIIRNKDDYYHLLNSVSTLGSWERWLKFMLLALKETANYTIFKIDEIMDQFQSTRLYVEQKLPNIPFFLLEAIFTQPYIKAIQVVGDKIKSRNTARKYLDQLCEINVLELKKIGNENVYINNDLMRIIED
ncbi:MAG: Fic family protein [Bacteroidales bacterium]|nr:Fic family protein [Bacteroidales bacterium]MCF8455011.1 Fic family protein [Bacteroidales bacterium]